MLDTEKLHDDMYTVHVEYTVFDYDLEVYVTHREFFRCGLYKNAMQNYCKRVRFALDPDNEVAKADIRLAVSAYGRSAWLSKFSFDALGAYSFVYDADDTVFD